MNIYVHLPEDEEEMKKLETEISRIHAQIILNYLKDSSYTTEKKLEIIKEIRRTLKNESK